MTNAFAEWNLFFESLWPKYGNKIKVIMANIERHNNLMIGEVTLADIRKAHEAREQALKRYTRDEDFQRRQDFEAVKQGLRPKLYDDELEGYRRIHCPGTGEWLDSNDQFCRWLDPKNKSQRLFWLQGIPGAGMLRKSSNSVLFQTSRWLIICRKNNGVVLHRPQGSEYRKFQHSLCLSELQGPANYNRQRLPFPHVPTLVRKPRVTTYPIQ